MDNNKDNALEKELPSENTEWVTRLLDEKDAVSETEPEPEKVPETEPESKSQARDTEAERILNENWSGEETVFSAPKKVAPKTKTIGDDLDFDALLAADALTEDSQQASAPAEEASPAEEPALVEETAPEEDVSPAEETTPEEEATLPEEAASTEESVQIESEDPESPSECETDALEDAIEEHDANDELGDEELDDEDPDDEDLDDEEDFDISPKKGRPKWRSSYGLFGIPHILATVVWLALILAIGVSLGKTLWVCCADVMAFGKEAKTVTITITEDDDIDSISKKLGDAGLVRYPGLFKFFADVTGKTDNIGVGTFTLNAQLDYNAMINAMYSAGPEQQVVTIMFPEGYNCAQIFQLLEENGVCKAEDLYEYARNGELKEYWFLEGVQDPEPNPEPGKPQYCRLEGYLAPDTYTFYKGDSPRRVLEKFLDEFDGRFTDLMKKEFENIKQSYADRRRANGLAEQPLTIHQLVTLASVIEKETASDEESYRISTVFYNRLVNPSIRTLGADATVHYAIKDFYWERELTMTELNADSPYNTRLKDGIPPGPICNMGVQALYAALKPQDARDAEGNEFDPGRKMHYFVYDPEKGEHIFAKTLQEHNNNLKKLGY